jgi:hypothetical protein
MKLLVITSLILLAQPLSAEKIEIFATTSERFDIPRSVIRPVPPKSENSATIDVYKIGARLGSIDTKAKPFSEVVDAALKYDQSQDPFFGDGFEYIARDTKGRHYIVFFEYVDGHKFLRGVRAAVAPLNDLGSNGTVFVGDPYNGVCFDKDLLGQLKSITEKNKPNKS